MTGGDATTTGPVTGLSHVQLRVSDVSVSAEWYAAVLGLPRATHRRPGQELVAEVVVGQHDVE